MTIINVDGTLVSSNAPFHVTWTFDGVTLQSGVLTSNGTNVTYFPGVYDILTIDSSQIYVNTTTISGVAALNTFVWTTPGNIPTDGQSFSYTVNPLTDNFTSGNFLLNGVTNYLHATHFEVIYPVAVPLFHTPGPTVGGGPIGLILLLALLLQRFRNDLR